MDEPSPKLDQHESSHSCALHVINDVCLTWWDAWHDAWWETFKCIIEVKQS